MKKVTRPASNRASVQSGAKGVKQEFQLLERLVAGRHFADVIVKARQMLRTGPAHPFTLKALACGLVGEARHGEAIPVLRQAICLFALDPELHSTLGIALSAQGLIDEAVQAFDLALKIDENDPDIWENKGIALRLANRWDEAASCFRKALEVHPGENDELVLMLASSLLSAGRNEEARSCYEVLLAEEPENVSYLSGIIVAKQRACDWGDLDGLRQRLRAASCDFSVKVISPFHAAFTPGFSRADLHQIAKANAHDLLRQSDSRGLMPIVGGLTRRPESAGSRIKIGYLSSDFCSHPVGYLIQEVIERHDRGRLEVIGYSTGPDDGSEVRHRLIRAFDRFFDVGQIKADDMARRIADDNIDILVDLQGWTAGNRGDVLALRPASVLVNWLGFPGTIGSRRLADYLIGDPVVTPPEHAGDYAERIVRLPGCYLPLDSTMPVSPAPLRGDAGLPENGFVFSSMNNVAKFSAMLFDAWSRLLRGIPDSVLWLARPRDPIIQARVVGELSARGVLADQVVFAEPLADKAAYVSRLQLADLALDTSPYSSHATGMDTLWAGVPMVTLLGESFAGRVGASLLTAAELDQCIGRTWDEYVEICLDLSRDRDKLLRMRNHLKEGRSHLPLFDMKRFVQSLDQLYADMWASAVSAAVNDSAQ